MDITWQQEIELERSLNPKDEPLNNKIHSADWKILTEKWLLDEGPYEISAGGSTTNTSRNQNLCPQVSVSTSSSTSLEIVRDTEEAEVNELGSQNQRTQFFFKWGHLETLTTQLRNIDQLNQILEDLQYAICLINQCTKIKQSEGPASSAVLKQLLRLLQQEQSEGPANSAVLKQLLRWLHSVEEKIECWRGCVQIDTDIQGADIIINNFQRPEINEMVVAMLKDLAYDIEKVDSPIRVLDENMLPNSFIKMSQNYQTNLWKIGRLFLGLIYQKYEEIWEKRWGNSEC